MSDDDVMEINDEVCRDSDIEEIPNTPEIKEAQERTVNEENQSSANINNNGSQTNDVIEIIDNDETEDKYGYLNMLHRIYKENKLFSEFIEMCLDTEHSQGMLRIIIKTLVPIYNAMDEEYKNSQAFGKLILVKMKCLHRDPDHKFSHLKDMCETMKCHKYVKKKRVELTTLKTNLKDRHTKDRKNHSNSTHTQDQKRRKLDNVIDLDEIDNEMEDSVINLEEAQTDVIVLEDELNKENFVENSASAENDSEQHKKHKNDRTIEIEVPAYEGLSIVNENCGNITSIPKLRSEENTSLPNNNEDIPTLQNDNGISNNEAQFLTPRKTIEYDLEDTMVTVKHIEQRIAFYKKEIERLDQLVVEDDTMNSPYIMSEQLKIRIVSLYKELCKLTGVEAVKRREVRLQVTDGRPSAHIKKLEELINDKIDKCGNPHFPDFADVVDCVNQANLNNNLGWNQMQIMNEARSVFTNCGLALQKKRQKRDWRDLLSRVRNKLDQDPADYDPVLSKRLEENRQIAVKKESDLFERFVKMEHSHRIPTCITNKSRFGGIQLAQDPSDNSEDESIDLNMEINRAETSEASHIATNETVINIHNKYNKKNERDRTLECIEAVENNWGRLKISQVTTSNKAIVVDGTDAQNGKQINITRENIDTEINNDERLQTDPKYTNISKAILHDTDNVALESGIEDIGLKISEVFGTIENKTDDTNSKQTSVSLEHEAILENIKTETMDVLKDMEQFGSNFTTTVFDIIDPFLVIEISSDSEGESDNGGGDEAIGGNNFL